MYFYLKDQTKIVADTVKEKNSILTETKNTEANYKKILASREAQKKLYEREVFEFESALKIAIDPNSIPSVGSGILKWPLDNVRITQYFGNTEFATKNPQVYKGSGHNGIDFGTPIGTPVKAAMGATPAAATAIRAAATGATPVAAAMAAEAGANNPFQSRRC
jgi:murein DD-endopeptidase MepM/ murein hydrolase activator NlpD